MANSFRGLNRDERHDDATVAHGRGWGRGPSQAEEDGPAGCPSGRRALNVGLAFERNAVRHPDEAAVFGDTRLTNAELNERTNQIANVLLARGLEKGARIDEKMYPCGMW